MVEAVSPQVVGRGAGFRLARWQVALVLVVILSLSQAATFVLASSVGFVPPGSSLAIAAAGVLLGSIEFLALGFVFAALVRLFGGGWSPLAVLSAFLIIPAATLVGRASMLATTLVLDEVDRPLMARDNPLAGYLLDGANWLLLTPSVFSVILVLAVVYAARIGGRLGWPAAALTGLCVAACSFAMGYAVYSSLASGDAVPLALVDMLRIG